MENKIIDYCNKTESIYGIFNIYKENFLDSYSSLSAKEKKPVLKALPYVYRMWYYSALIDETPLSPANFINMQVKKQFGEESMAIPIVRPTYKRKAIFDFQQEFKIFNIENHPVLSDLELFLQNCMPDIGVDESGLILEEEREKFIDKLTFKEIYYVTFLSNTSYELGLIKKLPSIGTHRASTVNEKTEAFFKLSKVDQLKKIVEVTITIASKQLSGVFVLDKQVFSVTMLRKLIKSAADLNQYIDEIMERYNLHIDIEELEAVDIDNLDDIDIEELPQESLMALSMRMEMAFTIDACITTPLGYYLQLIQPIYIYAYDMASYFLELYDADQTNVPLIKLFFVMPNGFDMTSFGKKIILDGKEPKDEFQILMDEVDFNQAYTDIYEYNSHDVDINPAFLDKDILNSIEEFVNGKSKRKKSKAKNSKN